MEKQAKILITGASGLVGSALQEALSAQGYTNVLGLSSKQCDLADWQATKAFFMDAKPDYVFHMAACVYGIMGNMQNKGRSFLENTLINTHTIEASHLCGVKKIVAMGSGCVYPYPSPGEPLKEDMIWLGAPHASEDSYAHSKRAMFAQLQAYKENYNIPYAFVISGNLYGAGDKFDPEFGHVTPALVRKFYEAKRDGGTVSVWGNGSAERDFMYAKDAGRALVCIMQHLEGAVNLGSGHIHAIRDIVEILADEAGMQGRVEWDASKPNGQAHRSYNLDVLRGAGFTPEYTLDRGVRETYRWYAAHAETARK
jgi:GDP-L-fucose synthase